MPARTHQKAKLARYFRKNMTQGEARVWAALRILDAPRFRRQAPVGPYILDFYAPRWKLCVEIDGPLHDVERDLTRDAWLLARGVTTLRYADEELDIEAIVRDV